MLKLKVLANDGIHFTGQKILEQAGHIVDTTFIPQGDLTEKLNKYDVVIVRSATKIRKALIDESPNIKVIARGGVGMDNIDVHYARQKGIAVYNTPAASSRSVAELAFGHMFSISRFLHLSNRQMPEDGYNKFKELKKSFSNGMQLKGKALGIIGFGRIGQETAKIGIALGMKVYPVDLMVDEAQLQLDFHTHELSPSIDFSMPTVSIDEALTLSDYLSIHIPFSGDKPIVGKDEMAKMKTGSVIVNTSRGGVVDEDALLNALNQGHIFGAGLDVFENEPKPRKELIEHPGISLTPHIGASTAEAQENIGIELAEKILAHFN